MAMSEELTRRGDEVFEGLFGAAPDPQAGDDPEFMAILRRVIFGQVFSVGELEDRTRELITVTILAAMQCPGQLTAHTRAALHVGATPEQIREAIYGLAPFLGFPRTLNAIAAMNEGLRAAGVQLPLAPRTATPEEERFERGTVLQQRLYGDEIREEFDDGTAAGAALPRLLTEFAFGDFESREGLETAERELLILCALVAMGLAPQVAAHVKGCLRAGLSRETVAAAILHCAPYTGMPAALNAYRQLRAAVDD
ncbi:carboxymuconolactone decarboxylase family protein, partial [Rothia kristinae]|uniref:carboxymuconolactone decarboxylase family protein n=1 Tax=Rothia kristinae TaxID=37923 RepID=UPI00073773C8